MKLRLGRFEILRGESFRLASLAHDLSKMTEGNRGGVMKRPTSDDVLARKLGYSSSSNGMYRAKFAALKEYGLLERLGRSDWKISQLGEQILSDDETERLKGFSDAALSIPLWRALHDEYLLDLPSTDEFRKELKRITGCSESAAKAHRKFIADAYDEDTKMMRLSAHMIQITTGVERSPRWPLTARKETCD